MAVLSRKQIGMLLVVIPIGGSIVFLTLPDFGNLLYIRSHNIYFGCTTKAEWIWLLTMSVLLMAPYALRDSCAVKKYHSKPEVIPTVFQRRGLFSWFLIINLIWFLGSIRQIYQVPWNALDVVTFVGGKSAWPGMWNLAFTVFPVQRISMFLDLMDLSPHSVVTFHVWTAKAVVFWVVLHTALLSVAYFMKYGSWESWVARMIPNSNVYDEGIVNFSGWIALFLVTTVLITSTKWFRKHFYDHFQTIHFASILFVFFSTLHDYNTLYFTQPALIAWIAERLVRRHQKIKILSNTIEGDNFYDNRQGVVTCNIIHGEHSRCNHVVLNIFFPPSLNWEQLAAGSYVYLRVPSISKWQSHPFSISAIDQGDAKISIHVKGLGDWTCAFIDMMSQQLLNENNEPNSCRQSIDLEIEGPYGHDIQKAVSCYDDCLFISGGVGITGISETVYMRAKSGKMSTFIWIVRTKGEYLILSDIFRRIELIGGNSTRCQVFITQSIDPELESINIFSNELHFRERSFNVQFVHCSITRNTAGRRATLACILSLIICYIIAREICCEKSIDTENGEWRECSFTPWYKVRCVHGTMEQSDKISFPLCTIELCFLCFRGLPFLMTLVCTPLLANLLLIFNEAFKEKVYLILCRMRFIHQTLSTVSDNTLEELNLEVDPPETDMYHNENSLLRSEYSNHHIYDSGRIQFQKPCLRSLVSNFVLDGDSFEQQRRNPSNMKLAVLACGSENLVKCVEKEVLAHSKSSVDFLNLLE